MLVVVQKGSEQKIMDVFEKWDLPCVNIGEVTDDGLLHFYMQDEKVAELPAYELVLGGGAPVYERSFQEPAYLKKIHQFNIDTIPDVTDVKAMAEKIIQLPNVASKRWIFEQYDSMVGTGNTNTNAPSDAAIVLAKPTDKALALTTDCNSRYVFADPYKGTMIAVAEAARNIICSGGEPLGVTNCLNFGNPYDPEVYYQFVKAIKGMGEACRKFDTPVTGGNVSFYNQSPEGPVFPTPTIGMVGILENINQKITLAFEKAGDHIFLLGNVVDDIASSEYLHKIHEVEFSPAPYFDIDEELLLHRLIKILNKHSLLTSAHDISEGGLIITLMESGFYRNLGFEIIGFYDEIRKDSFWFGEAQGRIVVSVKTENINAFMSVVKDAGVFCEKIGEVTTGQILVDNQPWDNIKKWKYLYEHALSDAMNKEITISTL